MNDLQELYQEIIVDHAKSPRNFGALEGATHHADGHNPLCGDTVTIELKIRDGMIEQAKFHGCGCAISTASASLLTEAVRGKSPEDAFRMAEEIRETLTTESDRDLGLMAPLVGVREYPMRVKCATLAWHALKAALQQANDEVSTED